MRVLVTGVSGFAGSFIARGLADADFDVVGYHRRESGFLAAARRDARICLVDARCKDVPSLPGPFDAVVHAAATSPIPGVTVADIVRDNVDMTFNLIDAARAWRCNRFIFCSSMSVYGAIVDAVVDERTIARDPDVYGMTKRVGEQRLAELGAELPALALRLPGIVGLGARRNWLSRVAETLSADETVRAFHLDRPFNNAIHVIDLCALIASLLRRGWTGFDAIVLGARGTITVRGVIERLAHGLGVPARIESTISTTASFILSSERAAARYGYKPRDIRDIIDHYAADLRSPERPAGIHGSVID